MWNYSPPASGTKAQVNFSELALDDFGTGNSSLSPLRHLPLQIPLHPIPSVFLGPVKQHIRPLE